LTPPPPLLEHGGVRVTMLILHEIHEVVGARERAFEDAFRRGWLPALAASPDARLLYFLHHAHGSGPSYQVVTLTALRDAAAWERLASRVASGDLAGWAREVDGLRHDVLAKLLVPLPWSPLQRIDLAAVPTEAAAHEPSLFMEDTVWPFADRLEEYVERSGTQYAAEMARAAEAGRALLRVEAGFRTAFGSHRRREVVLWQKVVQPKALAALLTREVPPEFEAPGRWMHDALTLRDRWQSRLLRTARWSPWH
jgi:hypothetical protein